MKTDKIEYMVITQLPKTARDLRGIVFGKLTVKEPVGYYKNSYIVWRCDCECGETVNLPVFYLTQRGVVSCGCSNPNRRHGKSGTLVHSMWLYVRKVYWDIMCDRWLDSFADFYLDVGDPPGDPRLYIVAPKDGVEHLGPDSFEWRKGEELRLRNRYLEYDGEVYTLTELAGIANISRQVLWHRIHVGGMTVEDAVNCGKG